MSEYVSKEPVMRFNSDVRLQAHLEWWKKRLYLDTWTIHAELVDEIILDGEHQAGTNKFQHTLMSSHIKISNEYVGDTSCVSKVCQEVTLVHELLHLCMNWTLAPDTHEGVYYDAMEHQNLEKMARSLVMAKYNLTPDWWDNKQPIEGEVNNA